MAGSAESASHDDPGLAGRRTQRPSLRLPLLTAPGWRPASAPDGRRLIVAGGGGRINVRCSLHRGSGSADVWSAGHSIGPAARTAPTAARRPPPSDRSPAPTSIRASGHIETDVGSRAVEHDDSFRGRANAAPSTYVNAEFLKAQLSKRRPVSPPALLAVNALLNTASNFCGEAKDAFCAPLPERSRPTQSSLTRRQR